MGVTGEISSALQINCTVFFFNARISGVFVASSPECYYSAVGQKQCVHHAIRRTPPRESRANGCLSNLNKEIGLISENDVQSALEKERFHSTYSVHSILLLLALL